MIKDINYKYYGRFYEIDENGNVWSKPRTVYKKNGIVQNRNRHLLSWSSNSDGYPTVKLCVDGKNERITVHRLVAMTFVDNQHNASEVNHIDCDRWNPSADNLEWTTHRDNVSHSFKLGRYKKPQFTGSCNPNAKAVIIVDTGEVFSCVKECAEYLISNGETTGSTLNAMSQIIKVCNGGIKRYLGHKFNYV